MCDVITNEASNRQPLSSVPSLANHIPILETHIWAQGGFEVLGSAVERPRFLLLRDACLNDDYFFVALHQMFCLWTIDPLFVFSIDGFRDSSLISFAFQQVAKLIRGNEGLSAVHLKWCTEFPSPLRDLLARSDHYRRTVDLVGNFLRKLAGDKTSMILKCQLRGYPPLVDEMVCELGLLSPILQGVFFTASRRTLGICDDETGAQMEQLFQQDREKHNEIAARCYTASPPSEGEVLQRNTLLAERYLSLRKQQQGSISRPVIPQQPNSNGSGGSIPITGTFGYVQPGPSVVHSAQNNGPISPSPDLAGRFQNLNHGPPLNHRASSHTTPNIPVVPLNHTTSLHTNSGAPASHGSPHQLPDQFQATGVSNGNIRSSVNQIPRPGMHGRRNGHDQNLADFTRSSLHSGSERPVQLQPTQSDQRSSSVTQLQQYTQNQPRPQGYDAPINEYHRHNTGSDLDERGQYQQRLENAFHGMIQDHVPRVAPGPGLPVGEFGAHGRWVHQKPADSNLGVRLIPLPNERLDPHPPNPDLTAIHQSHLKSPHLVAANISKRLMHDDPALRYYQAVKDFAVGPKLLSHKRPLSKFELIVPDKAYARFPSERLLAGGLARDVKGSTLQYRLRCFQMKEGDIRNPADCAVADTVWPDSIFIEIDGRPLEIRRKLHHGKDLPVDITPYLYPNNMNKHQVKVCVFGNKKQKPIDYAFSVEVVEVLHHQQIIDMCMRGPHISAEEALKSIQDSLSGSLIDDDEISMIVGDLTINLADPFLARIYDIPVRGKSCLHRDCFDLQAFLMTRKSKPKAMQQTSMVDVWKCPLCGKDARPYSLQVDDFLVSVRDSLEKQGLLDTKAIVVSADGTWKPKQEELSRKRSASRAGMDDDDSSDRDDSGLHKFRVLLGISKQKQKQVEVIELDDD
jgi:hypothetical protein